MKLYWLLLATLLSTVTNLSAAVWNYPLDGSTVGNPTYFDCTAPVTPNYMKLWVHGSSTSIWTVHNTNRLVFVYYLANGTYTMDCQYNDGTTHDNYITITVANNLYDAANVDGIRRFDQHDRQAAEPLGWLPGLVVGNERQRLITASDRVLWCSSRKARWRTRH